MPAFTLRVPSDFNLARDACSYGYFLLAPNYWDVAHQSLSRVLDLPGGACFVVVTQPKGAGAPLRVNTSRAVTRADRVAAEALLARMLRLTEDESEIAGFHAVDPRWKASGRGRLFRSPTMFEDVIKTVTSCNVTWPSTVQMNKRLCETLGAPVRLSPTVVARGFPSAAKIARTRPQTLRARCRVGYRDQRIVQLAQLFAKADTKRGVAATTMQDPATSDDAVHDMLIELPGIGPYAAANIMQLLGRYSRLPLDTESVRHGKTFLNMTGESKDVMKQVKAHFAPFGRHAFRAYWLEMWAFYESKHGPAWTWERDTTGSLFTAAQFNKKS